MTLPAGLSPAGTGSLCQSSPANVSAMFSSQRPDLEGPQNWCLLSFSNLASVDILGEVEFETDIDKLVALKDYLLKVKVNLVSTSEGHSQRHNALQLHFLAQSFVECLLPWSLSCCSSEEDAVAVGSIVATAKNVLVAGKATNIVLDCKTAKAANRMLGNKCDAFLAELDDIAEARISASAIAAPNKL